MSLATRPVKNQIAFYEKCHVIPDARNGILLNPIESTTHLLKLHGDCIIQIESIPDSYNLPDNSFIEHFIILDPSNYSGIKVIIHPLITFDYIDSNILELNPYEQVYLHFFTFDTGKTWYGFVAGKYQYTSRQSVINTPEIVWSNPDYSMSINSIQLDSTPLTSTIINATHISSNWKITSDEDGEDILVLDENSPDLTSHKFAAKSAERLSNGSEYYGFVQYISQENIKPSKWSEPFKFKCINLTIINPNTWKTNDYVHTSDNMTGITIATNKYNLNRYIKTNIPNIVDILTLIETDTNTPITILANNYIEINAMSGVLSAIQLIYNTSVTSQIELYADNATTPLTGVKNTSNNYYNFGYPLNLPIKNKLRIKFLSNCVLKHINFTLI